VERPSIELLPRFGTFYMCLEGPKSAFKKACRSLIGVDGCHLKTKFRGKLLIIVGRDPNDLYILYCFCSCRNRDQGNMERVSELVVRGYW